MDDIIRLFHVAKKYCHSEPFLMELSICLVFVSQLSTISIFHEENVAVSSYFSLCEFNLMCHFVSWNSCLGLIRLAYTHTFTCSATLNMCVKYKLMIAECCSFLSLSYSFQRINKFDGLIRINRPNYTNQVQALFFHRSHCCSFVRLQTENKFIFH